ncbi:gas vesicle protein GvpG [Streptomyces sp. CRN 30]|uniref:gas vesicle protein GvpG n=1 Tax=Streptomyces sp. CRN 30 TaxID=3075613 RepID=UPI002A7EDF30|nr:gas vesicle protein GvpG [Streptomyces sp. CRN 30]
MGLVSGLLLLPLAPVRGTVWVADHVAREARRQTDDPRVVHARLAALHRALEAGEIDEAAFEREEDRLLTLLERRTAPRGTTDRSQGSRRSQGSQGSQGRHL